MCDFRINDIVYDRWFLEWGHGRILQILKTRVKVQFKELVTYDMAHLRFLERVKT